MILHNVKYIILTNFVSESYFHEKAVLIVYAYTFKDRLLVCFDEKKP